MTCLCIYDVSVRPAYTVRYIVLYVDCLDSIFNIDSILYSTVLGPGVRVLSVTHRKNAFCDRKNKQGGADANGRGTHTNRTSVCVSPPCVFEQYCIYRYLVLYPILLPRTRTAVYN